MYRKNIIESIYCHLAGRVYGKVVMCPFQVKGQPGRGIIVAGGSGRQFLGPAKIMDVELELGEQPGQVHQVEDHDPYGHAVPPGG